MENKKRKWERDYEKYSTSTELDEQIAKLDEQIAEQGKKLDNKPTLKADYEEHQKLTANKAHLTAIKANLPKVKNILELRDQLDIRFKEIQTEIRKRTIEEVWKADIEKKQKQIEEIQQEMTDLLKEDEQSQKDLKGLEEGKERTELEQKLKDNAIKRNKNNFEFMKVQDDLAEVKKKKDELSKQRMTDARGKFIDKSNEDLENRLAQIKINKGRCSLACINLMEGKSWEDVEVALNEYDQQRLTAKGEQAKKIQQNIVAVKAANAELTNAEPANAEPVNAEPVNEEPVNEEPVNEEPVNEEPANEEPANEEPVNEEPANTEQVNEEQEENAVAIPTKWQKFQLSIKKLWAKLVRKSDKNEEQIEEDNIEQADNESTKKPKIISKVKEAWNKSKIKGFFKGIIKKDSNKEEQEFIDEEDAILANTTLESDWEHDGIEIVSANVKEEQAIEEVQEEPDKTEQPTKQDLFRQYLRDVAEKGMDGVEQERNESEKAEKEARRKAAIEKLKANREGKDTGATITNLDKELNSQNDDAR